MKPRHGTHLGLRNLKLFRGRQTRPSSPVTLHTDRGVQVAPVTAAAATSQAIIYVIGTGGTIVGTAASSVEQTYQPSTLSVANVIEKMPELQNLGNHIEIVDLFRVNSEDLTDEHWLKLARCINQLLANDNAKGVVVTHGTDTLEETAYFLNLVIKSDKPVVIVGAMRPATSLSADGPMNLYNAMAIVHAPDSNNRGVMVILNDTIFDARNVTKTNTTQPNTFASPNGGPIGHVYCGKVTFERKVTRKHTRETPFDISQIEQLPKVNILYGHAGMDGCLMEALAQQKPAGIVYAGVGDGNLHATVKAKLKYLNDRGIIVVRSSRTGSGYVTLTNDDFPATPSGTISANNLNPQKARILLMLTLTQSHRLEDIHQNYMRY